MALFPLLVAGGFFTPGMVRVLALAQELAAEDMPPLVDRAGRFGHRPLLVPRDFSAGFIPELLDLDQLFLGSEYRFDTRPQRLARVSSFPRSDTDSIVLDSIGMSDDVDFKDALMQEEKKEFLSTRDIGLLPLCGTLHAGNCIRDDDFPDAGAGPVNVIPEPGTAFLLALGLGALALHRRV